MQLRRVLPLSLLAFLASAGCVSCVSVGPQVSDVPPRGYVPPVGAPDTGDTADAHGLPLGALPAGPPAPPPADVETRPGTGTGAGQDQSRRSASPPRAAAAERHTRPAAQRRAHPPKAASAHSGRRPAPPARLDELCAVADGSVPPSIVDLCLRQYGR
ncbi:hypothetical protein ABZY44_07315 [Streptomyces sp. NPDC006544]|uniref:hypothetical protein n=1 Tax=Streptomyces sp. NPDC006544 TaxID=3154583 RepID=UPI0033A768D3